MFTVNVRDQDYRVDFWHDVPYQTHCLVYQGETWIAEGLAFCSKYDRFNRATGRKVSLGRALKNAGFNKLERADVWAEYFEFISKKPHEKASQELMDASEVQGYPV